MQKATFQKVFNRKNLLNKEGKAPIQVQVYFDKKRIYFDTKIKIKPSEWDDRNQKIKNVPNAIELNNHIDKFIRQLQDIELRYTALNKPFNLDILKYNAKNGNNECFLKFYETELNSNKSIAHETYKTHKGSLSHLQRFSKGTLNFGQINLKMIHDFENYLYSQGKHINTIDKTMRNFKTYLNKAIDREVATYETHPFKKYKSKTIETKREYLTEVELSILENMTIPPTKEYLAETLERFLFSCYTGLRDSDINELKVSDFENVFSDSTTLRKLMKKTKEMVLLPISKLRANCQIILEKRLTECTSSEDRIFKKMSNQLENRHLKEIGEIAKVEKKITFHVARHTYAMYLINKGVNIITISKAMGHRKLATTQIYSKMNETDFINSFKGL